MLHFASDKSALISAWAWKCNKSIWRPGSPQICLGSLHQRSPDSL